MVIVVTAKLAIIQLCWIRLNIIVTISSLFVYLICLLMLNDPDISSGIANQENIMSAAFHVLGTPVAWLLMLSVYTPCFSC